MRMDFVDDAEMNGERENDHSVTALTKQLNGDQCSCEKYVFC